MDFQLVEYFLRIAEHGSINKAATDLNMTQPALSRRLLALEHSLGTSLLVRDARGVKLSDAGMMLASRARPILRQIELLKEDIGRQTHAQVSIGLPFSMQRMITAPFAAAQLQAEPNLMLRVYEGFIHALGDWMQQGLIDIAIMDFKEGERTQYEKTPLVREHLFLVGNAQSGLSLDRPVTPQQLGRLPLIIPGRPNLIRLHVENFLRRHEQKFIRAAEAETLPLCLELTRQGLGHTVMPHCALYDYPNGDALRAAPIKGMFITWSMYVNQGRLHSTAVRRTARALSGYIRKRAGSKVWRFAELAQPEGE